MAEEIVEDKAKQRKEVCSNCRFWDACDWLEEEAQEGECRRSNPIVSLQNIDEKNLAKNAFACWPLTYSHDWCGEHKPIAERKPNAGNQSFEEIMTSEANFAANSKPIQAVREELMDAVSPESGCLKRMHRSLLRNNIATWEQLVAMSQYEFSEWKQFGESSHAELVKLAKKHGFEMPPWNGKAKKT